MGYASSMYLPSMFSYADARRILDNTKPIRGHGAVPLGRRKDWYAYSIKDMGDYIAVLEGARFEQIKYYPDDRIELSCSTFVSYRQMLWHVLSIRAWGRNSRTVIEVKSEDGLQKYALNKPITIKYDKEKRQMKVLTDDTVEGYRLNRKGANIVRARYKSFTDYARGMLSLMSDENSVITMSMGDMVAEFGVKELFEGSDRMALKIDKVKHLFVKASNMDIPIKNAHIENLFGMIDEGDSNYHRALLHILLGVKSMSSYWGVETNGYEVFKMNVSSVMRYFDSLLLRAHVEETLTRVKLSKGSIPNDNYSQWVHEYSVGVV